MSASVPQGGTRAAQIVALGSPGGQPAHGKLTVGVAAAVARAFNVRRRSITLYNAGPGIVRPGTSAVTTDNSIPIAIGVPMTIDRNNAALYLVSDQAATTVYFYEEIND